MTLIHKAKHNIATSSSGTLLVPQISRISCSGQYSVAAGYSPFLNAARYHFTWRTDAVSSSRMRYSMKPTSIQRSVQLHVDTRIQTSFVGKHRGKIDWRYVP
jgi:hypothetical protein